MKSLNEKKTINANFKVFKVSPSSNRAIIKPFQ